MNELPDEQKSVALAKVMGVELTVNHRANGQTWYRFSLNGKDFNSLEDGGVYSIFMLRDAAYIWDNYCPNLYTPANMALAWRVHLWALNCDFYDNYRYWLQNGTGWAGDNIWWEMDDAQRAWLDKVLQLATEAGMVEA